MSKHPTKHKQRVSLSASMRDKHVLYSASVQTTSADLGFAERAYKTRRGRLPKILREDFCGTALLSADWVKRRPAAQAYGIDLDRDTLEWGRHHYVDTMPSEEASRVHLQCNNVLTAKTPPADLAIALNFSYFIFKDRNTLGKYFRQVYRNLAAEGVFVLDIYGGTSAATHCWEERVIKDGTTPDGTPVPRFKFIWEHEHFNAVTNELLCHIHFKFRRGPWIRKAFTYDWRLWSIPEVRELLEEAGFSSTEVFSHGWDAQGENNGIYRRRSKIVNEAGWIGYVAAYK